jgi:hypothetical protein
MTSRFKVLVICFGAAMALSALMAGVAQAARPVQPQFTINGETIKSNITVEVRTHGSRLWVLGVYLITCRRDEVTAVLEPRGLSKSKITLNECSLHIINVNSDNKHEEGEEFSRTCGVSNPIVLPPMRSRLVWAEGKNDVLTLVEPEEGTSFIFWEIIKTEGTCLITGTDGLEGAALSWDPRFSTAAINEEAIMNVQLFENKDEGNAVKQRFTKWEVEQAGSGKRETGTAKLGILESEGEAAFESIEQVEQALSPTTKRRVPYGITE